MKQMNMYFAYPLKNPIINQQFGEDNSKDPIKKSFYNLFDNKHPGVDFPVKIGTKVFSSFPGIVVRKEFHKGMGNVLGIRNGNIVVLYAHLSEFKVELGSIVEQNDLIGLSGNTGDATTEPHLHLETRDVTKPTLKEMVFDPPFEKELKIKPEFKYKVNNSGTVKTLKFLSIRYFGSEKYWRKILEDNPSLYVKSDEQIDEGVNILIPNY
ncbi:MAG TPA: M23 family metallopeptidase [Patescibacteria group bacterium]|nr:M23 family metallopeptidase [Patescibacteria group bacterium]